MVEKVPVMLNVIFKQSQNSPQQSTSTSRVVRDTGSGM